MNDSHGDVHIDFSLELMNLHFEIFRNGTSVKVCVHYVLVVEQIGVVGHVMRGSTWIVFIFVGNIAFRICALSRDDT